MYLSYEEYKAKGGTMEEAAFSRFAFGAEQAIRRATFGRVDKMQTVPEAVKWLVFELVGISEQAAQENANVTAEKVGEWSKSYEVATEADRQAKTNALIRNYLMAETDDNGVPLLYLGVDV